MSLALVAVLIIVGFVGVAALAVGIPLVFGLLAYDIAESRKHATPSPAHAPDRIAAERGVARGFVVAGGLFWSVASFAGLYSFQETGMGSALMGAFIPLVAVLATLVVGWYFERVTAVLLAAASLAVIAWGVVYQIGRASWRETL